MVHLMFGLEGSGFIISISLTFLLIGLVVYLMKRQMRGLEQKFCSIFELSQNLATSIEHIKSTQIDRRKEVHVENYSESENDTDEENDCPEGMCPINRMFESIKIIDINDHSNKPFNYENNELEKMLNTSSIKELDNKDIDDLEEDDLEEDDLEEDDLEEDDLEEDDLEEDDLEEDDLEEDDLEEDDLEEDDKNDDKNNKDNKEYDKNNMNVITRNNELDKTNKQNRLIQNTLPKNIIDYQKLKVSDLRDLVIEQNILSEQEAKLIKKQKLVELLKKNN